MIRIFAGFDRREEIGFHAFMSSVMAATTVPVSVTPLVKETLEKDGVTIADGSNAFTYSRFLVAWLCGFQGWALFVDGVNMIARADLAELWAMRDRSKAVQVVKHDYKTKHPRKYVGTSMECANLDYHRKQWAAVMLINCQHDAWLGLTPTELNHLDPLTLLQLKFLDDEDIGSLPPEWNWLCDEHGEWDGAKLLHFTAGIPSMPAYENSAHSAEWFTSAMRVVSNAH